MSLQEKWRGAREAWRKAQRRRWVRWGTDALLMAAVLGSVMAWQTRNLVDSGTLAPAFVLTGVDGKRWDSAALRGKPVLLSFWAPWCGVCKTEAPTLSDLHKSVGDSAHVLSVAVAYENEADVHRFMQEHKVDYPVLLGDDALVRAYRVNAFPTTYFLDEDGKIRSAAVGYTTWLGLRWRLGL